jgi:hypothetical protein
MTIVHILALLMVFGGGILMGSSLVNVYYGNYIFVPIGFIGALVYSFGLAALRKMD